MENSLRYRDERDRAHGVAGAVIGICAYDGERLLISVNLDSDPGESLELKEHFYLKDNSGLYVSGAWRRLVSHYRLAMAMCIGDLLCRRIVGDNAQVSEREHSMLKEAVLEPYEECALEQYEASNLFENCFNNLEEIFQDPIFSHSLSHFVEHLQRARSMSRYEIIEHLRGMLS